MNDLLLENLYKNILICPECGSKKEVVMLNSNNSNTYECGSCNHIIQGKDEECCIYCEYGEVKCPAEQLKWN